eukprot:scaffold71690_cov32-Tisochrysis_lutea.AAC.5
MPRCSSNSTEPRAKSAADNSWPRAPAGMYGARKWRSDRRSSTRTRASLPHMPSWTSDGETELYSHDPFAALDWVASQV